jgi:uncharacterized protein (TIGR02145 family)
MNGFVEEAEYMFDNTNGTNGFDGAYYSWLTATAGSGATVTTPNSDAPYSICPKNWSLPTSLFGAYTENSNQQYRYLIATAYRGSKTIMEQIWNPVYGGRIINGNFHHSGSRGNWWSATRYYYKDDHSADNNAAVNLYMYAPPDERMDAGSIQATAMGMFVRCVAR